MTLLDVVARQVDAVRGRSEPLTMPMLLTGWDKLEKLGEAKGRTYYLAPRRRGVEYVVDREPTVLTDADDLGRYLPNTVVVVDAGEAGRTYTVLREVKAGAYVLAASPPMSRTQAPRPLRPAIPFFERSLRGRTGYGPKSPAIAPARGAAEMLRRAAAAGHEVSIVGGRLRVVSPGGVPDPDLISQGALLLAELSGTGLRCVDHASDPAVALDAFGTPWCAECAS